MISLNQHIHSFRSIPDLDHHHQISCPAPKPEKTAHDRTDKRRTWWQHNVTGTAKSSFRWCETRTTDEVTRPPSALGSRASPCTCCKSTTSGWLLRRRRTLRHVDSENRSFKTSSTACQSLFRTSHLHSEVDLRRRRVPTVVTCRHPEEIAPDLKRGKLDLVTSSVLKADLPRFSRSLVSPLFQNRRLVSFNQQRGLRWQTDTFRIACISTEVEQMGVGKIKKRKERRRTASGSDTNAGPEKGAFLLLES